LYYLQLYLKPHKEYHL